jgi:hypothetical protein
MSENDDKYALSNSWARGAEYKKPFDYTIEATGQVCLIRRLDMGDLLKLGIAEELDFMSKALVSDAKPGEKDTDAIGRAVLQADNFSRMEVMINTVCVAGVVKPKLQMPPRDEAARQPGQIYADSIPFNDRMELFGVIFETEGLTDFREEQANGVGNVANVQDVQLPADGPVGVRSEDTEGVLLQ